MDYHLKNSGSSEFQHFIPTFYALIPAMKKRYDKQNKPIKKPGMRR